MNELEKMARSAIKQFFPNDEIEMLTPYGSGHINTTYLLVGKEGKEEKKYILQMINTQVFQKPDELMSKIRNVTEYLREKIAEQKGDVERETLNIVPTAKGEAYYQNEEGKCWRIYRFIDHATCFDLVKKPEDFYESAVAFGKFQRLLAGFDAGSLYETIPHFHDTYKRYCDFETAVKKDVCGRVRETEEEIVFVRAHVQLTKILGELQQRGELPLRVTHNDTKLNNVMIDEASGRGICVIDLDTVMPGLAVNDFGDSIRFGANTAYEDEQDLSKVSCSLELFRLYTKGFLEGVGGSLTDKEIQMLPTGAKVMTLECGIRFLTDYLEGDHYFKIHREKQNLDRARCQFALLKDMEEKESELQAIVEDYYRSVK